MGTIFNQPVKQPKTSLENDASFIAKNVKMLAEEEKISIDVALRCFELAKHKQNMLLSYSVYNTVDEYMAGIAELWKETIQAREANE